MNGISFYNRIPADCWLIKEVQMHTAMDFIVYLAVLGIMLSFLITLGFIGYIWEHKFKILSVVTLAIAAYITYKKRADKKP